MKNFIFALLIVPAIVTAGGLKGASNEISTRIAADAKSGQMIDVQNVAGPFPTNPTYAYFYGYDSSDCSTQTIANYYLANTCIVGSSISTYITCDGGVATYRQYSDNACTNPTGTPFVMSPSCLQNPIYNGNYNMYYTGGCGNSIPYPSAGNWDVETNYYNHDCSSRQVVATRGYVEGYCYAYVGDSVSFQYKFPTHYVFTSSGTCQPPAVSIKNVTTTCTPTVDDDGAGYQTYMIWSEHSPSSFTPPSNTTANGASTSVSMSMKLLLSIVSVAFYYMKN